jgi:hypothetical protein
MSVNVDGETEKAVDSIIERLLAVCPPLPCRVRTRCSSDVAACEIGVALLWMPSWFAPSDSLWWWPAGAGKQAGQGMQLFTQHRWCR